MMGASPAAAASTTGAAGVASIVTGVAPDAALAGLERFISPKAAPVCSGSFPNSAGSTTVKKMAAATNADTLVAFRIRPFDGASTSAMLAPLVIAPDTPQADS